MGGCVGSQNQNKRVTMNTLVDQVMRIKLCSEQKQAKMGRELQQKQNLLIEAFGKDQIQRSKTVEKAMIGRTVYTKNIIMIYKYIQLEAKRLLDGKELFEKWETLSTLLPSVNTLIYSSIFLMDQWLQKFYESIKRKFPDFKFPMDSDIRIQLVRYHRHTQQNSFIMQFSAKTNIEVTRINQVGHKYQYGAGHVSYSLSL